MRIFLQNQKEFLTMNFKSITLRINKDIYEKIRHIANIEERSVNNFITVFLKQAIKTYDKENEKEL